MKRNRVAVAVSYAQNSALDGREMQLVEDVEKLEVESQPELETTSAAVEFRTLSGVALVAVDGDERQVEATATETIDVTIEEISYWKLLWKNRFLTSTYCLVFWSFGIGVAFLGPTILDLGCQTGTEFTTMSWVFFSQTLFVVLGSTSGGFLASRISKHVTLFTSMLVFAATLVSIPFCKSLFPLASTLAVMGYFMGVIDTVTNVAMIELYGKQVGPFLQGLHFFYGVGAFVAPLVAEPYLLNVDCTRFVAAENLHDSPLNGTDDPAGRSGNASLVASLNDARQRSQIHWSFWIMGVLQVPVLILIGLAMFRELLDRRAPQGDPAKKAKEASGSACQVSRTHVILLAVFASLLLFFFDGLQSIFGSYLYSFAVKTQSDSGSLNAAYLNALFWGTFAFGRLLSIFIATVAAPQLMLFVNILGCFCGVVLLTVLRGHHFGLLLGTSVFGLFLSSVYPSSIAIVESYIEATPLITTCIVTGGAVSEMLMPVIVGHEFGTVGPDSFLLTCVSLSSTALFVFAGLILVGTSITGRLGELKGYMCCWRKSVQVNVVYKTEVALKVQSRQTPKLIRSCTI